MLQVITSLLSFVHKVLILRNDKRLGWAIGIIAGTLSVAYFYAIGLFVFSGLEIGLLVLMGYGLLTVKNKKIEDAINLFTGVFCIALAYFSFSGILTVFEALGSIGALFGIYFLTHNKDRIGWIVWVITHAVISYVTFEKGQIFFVVYQLFSLAVALYGAVKSYRLKVDSV